MPSTRSGQVPRAVGGGVAYGPVVGGRVGGAEECSARVDGDHDAPPRVNQTVDHFPGILVRRGGPGQIPQGLAWGDHVAPDRLGGPLLARGDLGGAKAKQARYQHDRDQ